MSSHSFPEVKPPPDPVWHGTESLETPIVIDFGSYQTKAGFATQDDPFCKYLARPHNTDELVCFASYYSRYKQNASDSNGSIGVGNDLYWVSNAQARKISPFDYDVPYQQDAMEYVLDHTFAHLLNHNNPSIQVTGNKKKKLAERDHVYDEVSHPVLVTEAPLIPSHSRLLLYQLMFECYRVPALCSGIGQLFGYYYDHINHYAGCYETNEDSTVLRPARDDANMDPMDAMIVSSGYTTSHIIPILNNEVIFSNVLRVGVGGSNATDLLAKTLHLKYHGYKNNFSSEVVDVLKQDYCYVAENYDETLLDLAGQPDAVYIDLPNANKQAPVVQEMSEEDRALKEQRRSEHTKKMKDMHTQRYQQKIDEKAAELKELEDMMQLVDISERDAKMAELEIPSEADAQRQIKELQKYMERVASKKADNELMETADEELNDEQKAKKQTLLAEKAEARRKKKASKEDPYENMTEEDLLAMREGLAKKITDSKDKTSRHERIKLMNAASNEKDMDLDFGVKDSDWNVYNSMDKGDSYDRAKTQATLNQIDRMLYQIQQAKMEHIVLNLERIRAPEVVFQPSIVGIDQMGISEAFTTSLSRFPKTKHQALVKTVYLTGGATMYPGMRQRLFHSIRQELPTEFSTHGGLRIISQSSKYAPWRGAAMFASQESNRQFFLTKAQYEEEGPYRLYPRTGNEMLLHFASNRPCK